MSQPQQRYGHGRNQGPTPEEIKAAIIKYSKWSPLLLLPIIGIFIVSGVVNVGTGKMAVLIKKTGDDPETGSIIAGPDQKGIQNEPLPEGLYWKNPYTWDWVEIPKTQVPQGMVGIRIRQYGKDLEPGQIVAGPGQKGIIREPLSPGVHFVNTLVETVVLTKAVEVPAGYVGVVTKLAGTDPKIPNQFVVERGEKGVQKDTLPPGMYYPNPYVERINPVDLRAHRFDMEGVHAIMFPSTDGFPITMVGTIEWYIDAKRVAKVFVKYVDTRDVITCIVEKIILPNARTFSRIEGSKHLARDFISGVTRQKFQTAFKKRLETECAERGILIRSALVRDTLPPDEIANPIRQREIAIREADKYKQEMDREIQEKQLAMETKLMARKTKVKDEEARVAISITKAKEEQRVAIIKANRMLEVAKLELEAAKDQASALRERGQADADVVVYNNKAKAAGIKAAREAFVSGSSYVKYLYYKKIAPALAYILANTDGPFANIFQEFASAKTKKK